MNVSRNKSRSRFVPVAVLLSITVLGAAGCNKDEPPPPLPAAKTAEVPKAEPLKITFDAGKPPEEEKKTGGGGGGKPAASLSACCAALRQNAASAPPPTGDYMLQAAALCDSMAASGANKQTLVAAVMGALKGAQMPAGCR
jgi:hypothetical protein